MFYILKTAVYHVRLLQWSDINPEMPNFRVAFAVSYISLTKEVTNICLEKPSDWDTVATKLSDIFSSKLIQNPNH